MGNTDEYQTVHLWSLSEDVVIESETDDGELVLSGPWGPERIAAVPPVVREALHRMELGPVLLKNVEPRPDSKTSKAGVYLVLLPVLERLSHLVVRTLGVGDFRGPLLSVCPVSPHALFSSVRLTAMAPIQLPRGVSFTLEAEGFALERDGSTHRVLLHRPEAVWVVGMLVRPVTPDAVSDALPLPRALTWSIIEYLAAAGMVTQVECGAEAAGMEAEADLA